MTDGYYAFNSSIFPLESLGNDPRPTFQIGDPVLYQVCAFFTQLLNTNLMPRLSNEAVVSGLTHSNYDNWQDNLAVAQTVMFPLYPQILTTTDFQFPLLAIHVEEEHLHQWTLTNTSVRADVVLSWVLPPLTPRQMNRLYPFFRDAVKAWLAYGPQGYDPKVNPQGPSVWQTAGLSFGAMQSVRYMPYLGLDKDKKHAYFPSIQMRISLLERAQQPVPQNYEAFSGISTLQENLVDGYNPANPIVDFIDGYVYPNISLTSCVPNSGTINGNTLLTIYGTGFPAEKIARVSVCGADVRAFNVQSPTVLLAVTNPGITTGTGDIVAYDQQNNPYTLHNGFTYT